MSVVKREDRGAVCHIVLNRPSKRNALNAELISELAEAFSDAAQSDARCIVVRGAGPMFSAGMDVNSLRELSEDPSRLREHRAPILRAWNILEETPKPTICQIHGGCLGGAMELALCCDMRVMATDAVCGLVETRIGLVPDLGGSSRLPAVVGLGVAKELVMTGRVIDGHEAHRIGFANRCAESDELEAATETLCNELLACAPTAVGLAKRIIDNAARPTLGASLEQEGQAQQLLAQSADFAEGARAFGEKRQPQFAGR